MAYTVKSKEWTFYRRDPDDTPESLFPTVRNACAAPEA